MDQTRERFTEIEDPCHASCVDHKLVDVLILVMGCAISGITEVTDMMVYFRSKTAFSREHFGIEKYPFKGYIMLDCLNASGQTITADAMHCQKSS